MGIYIGLDIGGTKLMVAVADGNGRILRRRRADTAPGLEEGLAQLERMTIEVAAGEAILGMGAAIGAPLEWESGVVSPLHQPA
jgi:glucokinase